MRRTLGGRRDEDAAIGLPELADNPIFASLRLARLYGRPQADRLTDFELARCHALASRAVRHLQAAERVCRSERWLNLVCP